MKRCLDLICVSIGLTLLAPLLGIIAVAIWLDDGGPIFFRQIRIGRGFQPFQIWKFRTMKDREVTRVGRWLRQSGLDELPQIFNIAQGEMSVVGPRPLTADDVSRLYMLDEVTVRRWKVKPGLTGLAQIDGGRGISVSRELDLKYVANQSIGLDVQVIAASAVINLIGKRRARRIFFGRSQ